MDKPIITPSVKVEFNELHIKQLIEEYIRVNKLTPEGGKINVVVHVDRGYEDRMSHSPDTARVIATWKPL